MSRTNLHVPKSNATYIFACAFSCHVTAEFIFHKLFGIISQCNSLHKNRFWNDLHRNLFSWMLPIQWLIVLHGFQIIAAQEEMLRKERELEEARKKLAHIRQQQYKFLPSELREDQSWTRLVWLDAITVGSWLLRMIGCSLYAELEMSHIIGCVTVRWLVKVKCDWLTWDYHHWLAVCWGMNGFPLT